MDHLHSIEAKYSALKTLGRYAHVESSIGTPSLCPHKFNLIAYTCVNVNCFETLNGPSESDKLTKQQRQPEQKKPPISAVLIYLENGKLN